MAKATPPADLDCLIDEVKAEQAKPPTVGAPAAGFDWSTLLPIFLALLEWWKSRKNPPTP